MNKMMKKYIEQVRAEPTMYIREKTNYQRLFETHPSDKQIVMYQDKFLPSFAKTFLYGLEFDFMMLEVLFIALMDRCDYLPYNDIKSGVAFGVLIAYLLEKMLIWMRNYQGKKNIALHTLSDERFLIS